ncbi:MAG TPA: hypothetical protein VHT91_31690 [Kofleriaceae bacterium]|nr:hypothetical protein [Kofleriaceae bacterium]
MTADEDMKAPVRTGDLPLRLEPARRDANGRNVAAQRRDCFVGGEVVPAAFGELHDELGCPGHLIRYLQKATPKVTFCKSWLQFLTHWSQEMTRMRF